MHTDQKLSTALSRRAFLRNVGWGTMALGLGAGANAQSTNDSSSSSPSEAGTTSSHNILFILVDQERYFRPEELPADYALPAHERLMRQGTTFINHRINSCVCTPSR